MYVQECDWAALLHYKTNNRHQSIDLPVLNTGVIIGFAGKLSEEQWKEIVEKNRTFSAFYKDYLKNSDMEFFEYAYYSGLSLIASLNLKPETTLIIQKL
jgi:hypothetical protein